MPTDNTKNPPPYASFGIFKSTVDTLSDSTIPTGPLDRRVLDQLSGGDHGALMSALRFLGYVDEERRATNTYRQLVEVSKNPAEFKAKLLEVIRDKYAPIVGNLDIQNGTITQLEKAFKDYGVPTGQMLTKTIRFYLKALAECGVTISTHIAKAKPRSPRTTNRNGTSKANRARREQDSHDFTPPPGYKIIKPPQGVERMPIPGLADAFIQYPANITDADCDLFIQIIGVLRVYAKNRGGKAGKS
jgi:hypothetical protein